MVDDTPPSYMFNASVTGKHAQPNLEFSTETPVKKSQSQDSANPGSPEEKNPEHFCGLIFLDGSVTALPIVPVKERAKEILVSLKHTPSWTTVRTQSRFARSAL